MNWRTLLYALGFGRRRGPRRAAELNAPHYLDIYEDPKLLAWSVGVLGGCVLDALLTLQILSRGGVELNPVMAFLLQISIPAFFSVKYSLTAVAVVFILLHVNFKLWKIPVRSLLFGLFCFYLALIGYEGWLLSGETCAGNAFSTSAAPTLSPQTLTAVRNRSKNQSTDRRIPMYSTGNPTALSTITIVTKPASGIPAAPMEAKVAVSATVACCMRPNSMPSS